MVKNNIILAISSCLIISCSNKFVNFNDFIENNMFIENKLLNEKNYSIQDTVYKVRITYSELGTHFGIDESPAGKRVFNLKYYTEIKPIEIININGNTWVKVLTNDNRIGWIESHFIEIKSVKNGGIIIPSIKFEEKSQTQ